MTASAVVNDLGNFLALNATASEKRSVHNSHHMRGSLFSLLVYQLFLPFDRISSGVQHVERNHQPRAPCIASVTPYTFYTRPVPQTIKARSGETVPL